MSLLRYCVHEHVIDLWVHNKAVVKCGNGILLCVIGLVSALPPVALVARG